jgi:hypothetical protein
VKVLTITEIDLFQDQGYLIAPGLLDEEIALRMQEEIWEELKLEFGIEKDNPSTWKTPLHSPRKAKTSTTNDLLINATFRATIDDLIGKETWKEPSSWGGFLITFPSDKNSQWTLHDKLWHWDYELFREPELGGLLIFSFFSHVPDRGGGTLVIKGSHKLLNEWKSSMTLEQLNRKHGQHRKEAMSTLPYLKELTSKPLNNNEHLSKFLGQEIILNDARLQVVELTGEPGDVVFCHPRLIHAPAGINLNNYPRMMRTKFLW